jgi:hypothetical protein
MFLLLTPTDFSLLGRAKVEDGIQLRARSMKDMGTPSSSSKATGPRRVGGQDPLLAAVEKHLEFTREFMEKVSKVYRLGFEPSDVAW